MLLVLSIALLGRQVRAEERHLTAMHGAEYIRWASSAGRFVPGIGRFK
jgi:protein-S-isoprenylcysteine O-methyltransferase Ste14